MGNVPSSSGDNVKLFLSLMLGIPAGAYVFHVLTVHCCIPRIVTAIHERRRRRQLRHALSLAPIEANGTSSYTHVHEDEPTNGILNTRERIHGCDSEQSRLVEIHPHRNRAASTSTNLPRTTNHTVSNGESHSSDVQRDLGSADTVARPSRTYASPHCGAEEINRVLEALPRFKASRTNKDNCTVCLEPLEESVTTQCPSFHPVHLSCLTSWLSISNNFSCPVCRTDLLDTVHV